MIDHTVYDYITIASGIVLALSLGIFAWSLWERLTHELDIEPTPETAPTGTKNTIISVIGSILLFASLASIVIVANAKERETSETIHDTIHETYGITISEKPEGERITSVIDNDPVDIIAHINGRTYENGYAIIYNQNEDTVELTKTDDNENAPEPEELHALKQSR